MEMTVSSEFLADIFGRALAERAVIYFLISTPELRTQIHVVPEIARKYASEIVSGELQWLQETRPTEFSDQMKAEKDAMISGFKSALDNVLKSIQDYENTLLSDSAPPTHLGR